MIGETLGHYRITERIGAGGMGEVYRAEDTTLGRDVAIKVLPESFASDPERLARFEREARLLASLNHPHVAQVYGFEQHDGRRFLVLELAEGEDLSERLKRGPIAVDEAIEIAKQIAEALEEAHEKGIVHRDLKPGNVKLAPDGKVKVLDFGLAKAWAGEAASGSGSSMDLSQSPTLAHTGTQAGIILGTAGYMSPEQARGKPVDKRADIWSFGIVLYEMLSGQRLFTGETVSDVLAAVLTREPDWDALPATTPTPLRRLLARCLERDPRRRLRDAGDARLLLDERSDPTAAALAPPRTRRSTVPLAAGAAALGGLALGWWLHTPPPAPAAQRITQMVSLTDAPGAQLSPSLSADAEQLLFVAEDGGDDDLFLQRVGGENAINLTADYPDDDFDPAFSPDRQRIAFASRREGGGIFVMGATGESPRKVSDTGFDPAWSPDGRYLLYTTERIKDPYSRLGPAQLWRVDLDSLERVRIGEGVRDVVGAAWSPSGRRIAFWSHYETVGGQRDIWTMAADGTDPVAVTDDVATDWGPFWSPDGRWLYFVSDRGGRPNLWRVAIDESSGRAGGAPMPVTSGVSSIAEGAIAADGRNIAVSVTREEGAVAVADFDSRRERLTSAPRTVWASSNPLNRANASADGEWIALATKAPRETLVVMRTDGSGRRRILDDEHRNRGPRWSPDARWISFYSNRSGSYEIWAIRPNGTDLRQITDNDRGWNQQAWMSGGRRLAVSALEEEGGTAVIDLGPGGLDVLTSMPTFEIRPQEGDLFSAYDVAPDDDLLVGTANDERGETVLAFGRLSDGRLSVPVGADGRPFRPLADPVWLDASRAVFWDSESDSALVWDLDAEQARTIPDVPGPATLQFFDGARQVLIARYPLESDIWMLTLE